jgi:hypothetical protein
MLWTGLFCFAQSAVIEESIDQPPILNVTVDGAIRAIA